MKVALVKQLLDTHGPWRSIRWAETSAAEIVRWWPGRALFWAMTVLLEADWYVLPQQGDTWYTQFSGVNQPADRAVIEQHTSQLRRPQEIPWDAYDVVISLDPCLRPPRNSRTLFAYYMNEHVDVLYTISRRKVLAGYDLFLDHRLQSALTLTRLSQPIACPYLWEGVITRQIVWPDAQVTLPEEAIFVEWRTLTLLAGERARQWRRHPHGAAPATLGLTEVEAAQLAERLARYFGLPVRYRLLRDGMYNHLPDPPQWGELLEYLRPLAQTRYYVSLFAFGAGQALVDAAAMGAIVFGSSKMAYHRLVCHPACLCATLDELPERVRQVQRAPDLQAEVLAWQATALRQHFDSAPRALLAAAAAQKRSGKR